MTADIIFNKAVETVNKTSKQDGNSGLSGKEYAKTGTFQWERRSTVL